MTITLEVDIAKVARDYMIGHYFKSGGKQYKIVGVTDREGVYTGKEGDWIEADCDGWTAHLQEVSLEEYGGWHLSRL